MSFADTVRALCDRINSRYKHGLRQRILLDALAPDRPSTLQRERLSVPRFTFQFYLSEKQFPVKISCYLIVVNR